MAQKTQIVLLSLGIAIALLAFIILLQLRRTASADNIRFQCYEEAIAKRRRVVQSQGNSDAYLNQITESSITTGKADPEAFLVCQRQGGLTGVAVQTVAAYEQAHEFRK